ncbi:BTB/POZ domain [Trinorchestia longiramus]|nr:BTB/POZ domain [Trinorchestia longiramus]
MSAGLLSLKWNNHNSTLLKLLSDLQSKCRYEDATVACGGKLYPVHRLVLSGCSRYFEQMFTLMHGKHPIIVLKDIPCEVFEALLNYMYVGRVEVKKENLGELINAAACLEIKGLAVSEEYEDLSANTSYAGISSLKRSRDHFDNFQDGLKTPIKIPKLNHISSINFEDSPSGVKETSSLCAEQKSDLEEALLQNSSKSSSGSIQNDSMGEHEETNMITPTSYFDVKIDETEMPLKDEPDKLETILENGPKECATVFDFEASTSDVERAEMVEAASLQNEQLDLALVDKKANSSDGSFDSPDANEDKPEYSAPHDDASCNTGSGLDNFSTFFENGSVSNTSYASTAIDPAATFDIYSMLDLHYDDTTSTNDVDLSALLHKSGFPSVASGVINSHKSPILKQQWQCPQCEYSTPVKQYITQHIRRHTGEKPFKCNLCDYRAAQKQSVTYHMRRHTGEKPFKCPHCTYCSSSRQNLDRHVRRHTGEMPYGCPYCSYRSITKGPVVDHMRAKHGEMECDKSLVLKLDAKTDGPQFESKTDGSLAT